MAAAREERDVQIMHMKSPSSFWVTDSQILEDAERDHSEVVRRERALARMYNRSKHYTKLQPIQPNEGDLVGVRHPDTSQWHRGKIDYVLETSSGFAYQVFLVDHGYPLKKIKISQINELPSEFKQASFAAYEVVLDEIVPLTMKMDFFYQKMVPCVADSWPVAAWNFVEKLIGRGRSAILKINYITNKVVFGDLFIDGILSISEMLCEEKYATRSREDFETVFRKIQEHLPNYHHNLEENEKIVSEVKTKQKFLVDYVQDLENRRDSPKLQEIKENVGYLSDDDFSQPSVGRGIIRQKNELSVGVLANRYQQERKRVSEVGKNALALRNNLASEKETCDSEDGLRKLRVECENFTADDETVHRSDQEFEDPGEKTLRNAPVDSDGNTSETESINKDGYTSTDSNSIASFFLQALGKTKQVKSHMQNGALASVAERKENITSDKMGPKSFNTSDSCDEKKRHRASVRYNQASKVNGNRRLPASSQSSESLANTTDSCDETEKDSRDHNRTNQCVSKDNSNRMLPVSMNKNKMSQNTSVDKISQNTAAENTNISAIFKETEKTDKGNNAAQIYSPTCLEYLQVLSKAKYLNGPTTNVPPFNLTQKPTESIESKTNRKAPSDSVDNSESTNDTTYHFDGTRKTLTKECTAKDSWTKKEAVNNRLVHENGKLADKRCAADRAESANTLGSEEINSTVCTSSSISESRSMHLETTSKTEHVKQRTQNTHPSDLPQKIDKSVVEDSKVRNSNQTLAETFDIVRNINGGWDEKTKGPHEHNRSKQLKCSNNGINETVRKSNHKFPVVEKKSKNKSVSFSASTSGTDTTNEEGYTPNSSSSCYQNPRNKAKPASKNRMQETSASVIENRRINLFVTKTEPRTHGELDESLTASTRILVHGDVRVKPVQSIYEANFPKEVHGALTKMGFRVPYRIQKHAWPAILRGQNAILVGPRSTGKTTACLVPLISFMIMKETYSELRMGSGPYVVILCSGCKSAQETYDTCETILALAGHRDVTVLVAYGGERELQLKTDLVNGCDILISTPKCLLRLLHYSKYMTNLNRLVHLFLDEVDVLAFKYLGEVKGIIKECKQMITDRKKLGMPLQLLAASEKWTVAVEQFAKNISKNFFVCISSYLEAAVYAKLELKLHFESKEIKASKVLSILEDCQGMFKVVIVCQYIEEVEHVVQFLKQDTSEVLFAHENVSHNSITATKQQWKFSTVPGCYPVLVCTDGVLPDLDIYDAMWLIHYSMPYTKTAFGFRFSCLMDNYNNMFKTTKDDPGKPYCSVHIFLEDTSEAKELPEVVRFIKRSGVSVDPKLEKKAAEIEKQKELSKVGVPLCYNLKAFGDCWQSSTCRSRHVIIKAEDEPKNIPVSGEVTIRVQNVIDANRFAARILDHKGNDNRLNTYPDNYFSVTYEVLQFYRNKDNRIPHGIPKTGDLCAVEMAMNKFYRARVTEIAMLDKYNLPKLVNVYLLDEGTVEEVKISQLLELPDKLRKAVPQVVEVFLCNIMPCDKDWSWSAMATCRVTSWLEKITENEDEDKCLRGKIKLSLGNALWLDPLEYCSYLENLNTWVKNCSLSTALLDAKLAVKNPEHMERLYQLCKEADIALPNSSETKRETAAVHQPHRKPAPKQPQWAYLDKEEYQQVVFVCADSPYRVFVRLLKFQDSLQRLMTELQQNADDPKDFQAEAGMYCIAKFVDDDKWNRAKVLKVLDNKVKIFYVDHGDTDIVDADQVAGIKEKYITKLPFQAIECSLFGVEPTEGGEWSEEATDTIYDFGENSILFVKVCETEQTATLSGGKLYKVIMIDTSTSADLMLNRILVEKGLATSVNDELKIYEDLPATKEVETLDSEEEVNGVPSVVQPTEDHSMSIANFDLENCDVAIEDLQEFSKYFGMISPLQSLTAQNEKNSELKKSAIEEICDSCPSDDVISTEEDFDDGPPPLISRTKIPCVNWYQDECFVYLRIMLTGIQKYYLAWDVTTLEFCAEVMNHTYSLKMELYSGVEPENLVHICKGLYLQITLRKIHKGYLWPRLLLSEDRHLWIKKDLEMFKQESESEEEETAASRYRKAVKAVSENMIPNRSGRLKDEHIVPDILALESEDECESDPWEPAEETVDFYDPLC